MTDAADNPSTTPTRSTKAVSSSADKDHPLPSVEFTLSCNPSSSDCMTPNSSADGSKGSRSSTTPTTFIFGNLHLSENISSPTQAPLINQPNIMQNGRTTYRDLHNVTPSPAGPASMRPSQQRPHTPSSPLGTVHYQFKNLNLEDGGGDVSDSNRSSIDVPEDDEATFNIRQEALPPAPIYDIRLQNVLRQVRGELTSLTQVMSRNVLVQVPDSALSKLYAQTLEASKFAYPATRTVGFIGDSGAGKSSLINSLLDQEGLARSSGDGAACTTVVTEFRSVNDTFPENYTVVASFMDYDEIRELLEELLSSVRKYYTEAFREVRTSEEQEAIKVAAQRAWDTLKSLFPHQRDFDLEFLLKEGDNAVDSIMTTLLQWAMAGLDHRPGGRDNLQHTIVAHHADQCMEHLDRLMANPEDDKPAFWPFVKLIRVYLRSPVLRTGLVLADLPGIYRITPVPLDQLTTLLRVSASDRKVPSSQLRRGVYCEYYYALYNRSDVNSQETARTAPAADAARIKDMDNKIRGLERMIAQTRSRRRQSRGGKMQSLAAEEIDLRDQKDALELQLKSFLVTRRNTSVTKSLLDAWGDRARIFCVSNKLYSDYRENDPQVHDYLSLSGVRELRQYCQSVPADAQFRATVAYLQNELPALLGSISQWGLAGSSTMTVARAEVLRDVLAKAEGTLKRSTILDGSQVHSLQRSVKKQFSDAITQHIRRSQHDWGNQAVEASLEWATWHHMTYAAFCRNYGTHQTAKQPYRCWNKEILGPGIDQLSLAWRSMLDWLEEHSQNLEDELTDVFQGVRGSIPEQCDLAPEALQNLLLNLRMRQTCIVDAVHDSKESIINVAKKIMDDTIGGHASSYIAGIMRPVYNRCMQEYGTGSDSRRKQTMHRNLKSPDIFINFARNIAADFNTTIDETFNQLDQKLYNEIANITRDLGAAVTVEGEVSEAGQHPANAEQIKRDVEACQRILGDAKKVVLELRGE
ncbi:hypothetical protein BO94DRAFT_456160 [Aspergillus sclerotioniger CBS 115572]|uniref:Uncharacterized protein n=1 Tax=Aspergillus sclerotioniger CBS 115572 TaxID=1450535 RepID=A0A317X9U9_9EURO|nr:hypothetical protein BO94DRAFT_456160 [Aspergillus sclerotioniger CBS 115572]PWY94991.1 hypothetical protein BO94DRAFT_456160 [Aspergillus sclerotioniger CBS 115572]